MSRSSGLVDQILVQCSGHGAGTGSPQNLANRPCPQADPARAAQCQIHRILYPPGGPHDSSDPAVVAAVRAQIAGVLRDWLDVVVVIDGLADDPTAFADAVREDTAWWQIASHATQEGRAPVVRPGPEMRREGSPVGRLSSVVEGRPALPSGTGECQKQEAASRIGVT